MMSIIQYSKQYFKTTESGSLSKIQVKIKYKQSNTANFIGAQMNRMSKNRIREKSIY